MPHRILALAALALLAACGSSDGAGTDVRDTGAADTTGGDAQADVEADTEAPDAAPDAAPDPDVADPDAADASDAACATLGCACANDDDCDSGYCLETPRTGALVCAELCDGDCSLPGFECRALENAGSDLVRLCVPEGDPYCQPCEVPADCGSLRTACVRLDDGTSGCATPCDASGLCPTGAECVQLTSDGDDGRFCVPAEGVCDGCYDPDGDLHGLGPDCLGGDHDELDPDSYEGAPELCDGADNDGDGERDEGFDLQTDDDNCGRCGARCADVPGSTGCDAGVCVVPGCEEGRADCDGLADNGCEVDLTDPARCGTCVLPEVAPGTACGACDSGAYACTVGGDTACVGDLGDAARNDCGGCDLLDELPGDACGLCGLDELVCNGLNDTICDGDTAGNACGGCVALAGDPDTACGACGLDTWACDGADAVVCSGDTRANTCGGCGVLADEPDAACGRCGLDAFLCDGTDATVCSGDTRANACGGCDPLANEPEASCGTCGLDAYVCDGAEATVCDGDTRSNECGGCTELGGVVGEACTPCDGPECAWVCDGRESLACSSNDRLIGLEVLIPPGTYTAGSAPTEVGRNVFETQHRVTLTRPFYLTATEVTVSQWEALMGPLTHDRRECESCPASNISFYEAAAYANARSREAGLPECYELLGCTGTIGQGCPNGTYCDGDFQCEGWGVTPTSGLPYDCEGYRLPTLAEFQYAAQAGMPGGSTWAGGLLDRNCTSEAIPPRIAAACDESRPLDGQTPVASRLPNPWGLYDMLGNKAEWLGTNRPVNQTEALTDPVFLITVAHAGGGSRHDDASEIRSTGILTAPRGSPRHWAGLRLARTAPDAIGPTACDAAERNPCGGCLELPQTPDTPCGLCAASTWTCDGANRIVCADPVAAQNACGGCGVLSEEPGDSCVCEGETCQHVCEGRDALLCEDLTPGPHRYISFEGTLQRRGSPTTELGRWSDEGIVEDVVTSYPIGVQQTEVTEAEWIRVMGSLPARMPERCGDDCPVTWVTWFDALAYANALSTLNGRTECYDLSACTGTPGLDLTCPLPIGSAGTSVVSGCHGRYRLPTEAEWERTARSFTSEATWAGDLTATDCSDATLLPIAWFCGNAAALQAVGGLAPNPSGLHDMLGNVAEWVWDGYGDYLALPGTSPTFNPTGPVEADERVIRGGSWADPASAVRAAARGHQAPDAANGTTGFRVVNALIP